jgi:predicted dehydrogenase
MSKVYRVGVVGCGGMGRSHTKAWSAHPRAEVVAVADIDQEAATALADENGIAAVYADYHDLLAQESVDIVSVPTWQGVRAEVTVAAAEAGVQGVFGEKPIAAAVGEADDMIAACDKAGTKLAIGHQRRFTPGLNEIRRLVAAGAIGEPTMVHHRAKANAGLLNTGTHAIDSWRYLLGDPRPLWVIGNTARTTDRWERRSPCEDLCMGLVCFEGGARGVYEGDLPEPGVPMAVVYGTEGQIQAESGGVRPSGQVLLQNNDRAGWQEIEPPPVEVTQYDEFVAWLDGDIEEHRSSGVQARYTLEIMMAIYESLRIRGVVELPLTTRECPLDLMIDDGTLPVREAGRYDLRAPFPDQAPR